MIGCTRIMFLQPVLLVGTICAAIAEHKGPQAILTVVIDDMGFFDAQPHNPRSPTPTLGTLAKEGILLERHYTYVFCSPTRRSFLTGRFPVHIVGVQADVCSNWTPLGMALLSGKLAQAGFQSHFIGKTNIGFQTTDHMPVNRNFSSHVGFLYGAEDYAVGRHPLQASSGLQLTAEQRAHTKPHCRPYVDPECMAEADLRAHTTSKYFALDFWEDDHPGFEVSQQVHYSTNFYTERTIEILRNFTVARRAAKTAAERAKLSRLWIHLCYQAVHSPFTDVPEWERLKPAYLLNGDEIYGNMLSAMDNGMSNITRELKHSGLYEQTLIICFSDNGGPTSESGPNNYPLRGCASSLRASLSVGVVCFAPSCTPYVKTVNMRPNQRRSKESPWEGGTRVASFVSGGYLDVKFRGTVSHSFVHVADWYTTLSVMVGVDPTDIYEGHDVDGVDIWPMITGENLTNPREYLPVTEQSIIWNGRWKYFSSSDSAFGFNGWSFPNGSKLPQRPNVQETCEKCLFDILNDPSELIDETAAHPEIVSRLSAKLEEYHYYTNASMSAKELEHYDCAALPTSNPPAEDWPANWPWLIPSPRPPAPTPEQKFVFDPEAHGSLVKVSSKQAIWQTPAACNEVALLRPTVGAQSFWAVLSSGDPAPPWVDVGLCAPTIPRNLSGQQPRDWMGDQVDGTTGQPMAWIYRARGLFRVANKTHSPGIQYGGVFGAGSNISVVRHSPVQLEFSVDGVSQGLVHLATQDAVPKNAVGCVGMCPTHGTEGYYAALTGDAAHPPMGAIAGPCCRKKSG